MIGIGSEKMIRALYQRDTYSITVEKSIYRFIESLFL